MNSIYEIEKQLDAMMARASGSGGLLRVLVSEVRDGIAGSLSDIRKDQRAHCQDENQPFFDLLIFDNNPVEPSLFFIAMFLPTALKIFVGKSVPDEIIRTVSQFAMTDLDGLATALNDMGVAQVLEIPRSLAEIWLAA